MTTMMLPSIYGNQFLLRILEFVKRQRRMGLRGLDMFRCVDESSHNTYSK